ncbi:flavodoxin domain-containing protein, partial [Arthrospira platensis SPKY2]
DAPDNAQAFIDRAMRHPATLAGLRYTLLALGDRSYAEFCAFGRRLDTWLQRSGASEIAPRIEVDAADETALCAWRHRLAGIAQVDASDALPSVSWGRWQLKSRRHLNPGSAGAPVFEVVLTSKDDSGPSGKTLWQAGDLLQLRADGPDNQPRSYSIASLPEDGAVHLLVRLQHDADGHPGLLSGLLTGLAPVGSELTG